MAEVRFIAVSNTVERIKCHIEILVSLEYLEL